MPFKNLDSFLEFTLFQLISYTSKDYKSVLVPYPQLIPKLPQITEDSLLSRDHYRIQGDQDWSAMCFTQSGVRNLTELALEV